jgi:hypothetical protein
LYEFVVIHSLKDGVQQRDLLNNQVLCRGASDINTIANVVGVLDKEEDARSKEFLSRDGKDEGQGEQRSSSCSESCDEVGILEGN